MLRFLESFDHSNAASLKWDGTMSEGHLIQGGNPLGRFGTQAGLCVNAGYGSDGTGGRDARSSYKNMSGTESTWTIGFGIRFYGYSGDTQILGLYEIGSGLHMGLWLDSSGRWQVRRNTTVLVTTGYIPDTSLFHWIEFKTTIHDSTGTYELRIDGVTITSATSQDTRNGGSGYVDRICFGHQASNRPFIAIDDIYFCDSVDSGVTGAPNNTFLGEIHVEAKFPSGAGNSTQFTPSAGSNYQCVDETAPNDDTDYVESSNVGDKDTYAMQNLAAASGPVYGMQLIPYAKKTDAGTRSICSVTRSAGTEEDSADKALVTGYTYLPDIREADPSGNQWTISTVNSMEAGIKVTA